jgi:signal transduction histidine kinase
MSNGGVVGVFNDVTERRNAEEKLRLAMDNVVKANQAKSEFMASMSHELRTPLNSILGFADMMGKEMLGPIGNPQYVKYSEIISDSGQHLLAMVNDILDIERIEAGKYDLTLVNFEVLGVVNECHQLLSPRANQQQISLKVSLAENLPPLHADRRAVLQILINLVTNAIKFTDPGGEVMLRVSVSKSHHKIEVRDSGIGIPKERLPTLTDPFTRHEPDPHKPHEGVGLGLAISNSLVELHGGELRIESEVGKGTTVTVTLPNRAS